MQVIVGYENDILLLKIKKAVFFLVAQLIANAMSGYGITYSQKCVCVYIVCEHVNLLSVCSLLIIFAPK